MLANSASQKAARKTQIGKISNQKQLHTTTTSHSSLLKTELATGAKIPLPILLIKIWRFLFHFFLFSFFHCNSSSIANENAHKEQRTDKHAPNGTKASRNHTAAKVNQHDGNFQKQDAAQVFGAFLEKLALQILATCIKDKHSGKDDKRQKLNQSSHYTQNDSIKAR